jgi:hypothetical protein
MMERDKPVIAMEINSLDAACRVLDFCAGVGYRCFGYAPLSFNPRNFKANSENVYEAGAAECGLLLLPSGQEEKRRLAQETLRLPQISTVDDLSLLLLQKPQYPSEILEKLDSAKSLPVPLIDIGERKLSAAEDRASSFDREAQRLSGVVDLMRKKADRDATMIATLADLLQAAKNQQSQQLLHADLSKRFDEGLGLVAGNIASLVDSIGKRDASIAQLRDVLSKLDSHVRNLQGHVDGNVKQIGALVDAMSQRKGGTLVRLGNYLKPKPTGGTAQVKVLDASAGAPPVGSGVPTGGG